MSGNRKFTRKNPIHRHPSSFNLVPIHFHPCDLRFMKYHGKNKRVVDVDSLNECDLVLTTYSTLVADRRNANGILHKIIWFRVVLDEGKTNSRLNKVGAS